jgi:hypothetical protein
MKNLLSLTKVELVNIEGGAPTKDTGFWYDVTWYSVKVLEFVGESLSHVKG